MTFKKALKQEQDKTARRLLDGFYNNQRATGNIKNYVRTDWNNDIPETQILQLVGCDVALKYDTAKYKFVDEKICRNYNETLYFEIGKEGSTALTGWAVSDYKKTDIIAYYIEDVGLCVLSFQKLKQWLIANKDTLPKHYSNEGKRRSNLNVKVKLDVIKKVFPNCFISAAELEFMARHL